MTAREMTPGRLYRFLDQKPRYGGEPDQMFIQENMLNWDGDTLTLPKYREALTIGADERVEAFNPDRGFAGVLEFQRKRLGFKTVEEYEEWTQQQLAHLVDPENGAKLSVRTKTSVVPAVLASGRLTTIHAGDALDVAGVQEKEGGFGSTIEVLREARDAFEKDIWAIPEGTPPEQRPIYGYIGTDREAVADSILSSFGDVKLTLKDSVRGRTTITYGDSNGMLTGEIGTDRDPKIPSQPTIRRLTASRLSYDLWNVEKVVDEGDGYIPPPLTPEHRDRTIRIALYTRCSRTGVTGDVR